ncbi:MAG TPA: transposase [Humisphaera sp.]|jgi:REP element-mobilizing transposase RayT|nr:transposase [Humisphaera sp.]
MALAYFITFHTYGTWLHGTSKGMGSVDLEHNRYGEEYVAPDAQREAKSREYMAQPTYIMHSKEQRAVVRDAIVSLCQERCWRLLALHVRTNHVHAVVGADRDPGRVMSDMKAIASRKLTRAGFDDAERRRWTRHGSTLHLFDEAAVVDKVDYVLNRQGAKMAYYNGRESCTS